MTNLPMNPESNAPATTQQIENEARAVQEIQASLIIAKRFPRDEEAARAGILVACQRPDLAEKAIYAYPRGGTAVTGPSIRLAEEIARHWGNLDYGLREIDRRPGISVMESYCWDMQSNVRARRQFEVPHIRYTRKGSTNLDDPRDIYEMIANQGARRLRACILEVIPGHVVAEAEEACQKTLAGGTDGVPIQDRAVKMVEAFKAQGVTQAMIEQFLGHKLSALNEPELVRLREIYNSLRDGYSARDQWFDMATAATTEQAADLKTKLADAKTGKEKPKRGRPKQVDQKKYKPVEELGPNKQKAMAMVEQLNACQTKEALVGVYTSDNFNEAKKSLPPDHQTAISEAYADLVLKLDRAKRGGKKEPADKLPGME